MWFQRVNPIIRGKVNYYLMVHKAVEANKEYGQKSHCFIKHIGKYLHEIDSYTRRRLRVAMIPKNPSQRKGWLMTNKWNNEYFARAGLVPGNWYFFNRIWDYSLDDYIQNVIKRRQKRQKRYREKQIKEGKEYYTKDRLMKIKAVNAY